MKRMIMLFFALLFILPLQGCGQTVSLPHDLEFHPGQQYAKVPVTVYGFEQEHITSIEMDIVFDSKILSPQKIDVAGTIADNWTVFSNTIKDTLMIAAASPYGTTGDGVLFNLIFNVRPNAPDTVMALTIKKLFFDRRDLTGVAMNGTISIKNIQITSGIAHPRFNMMFTPYPNPSDGIAMLNFFVANPAHVLLQVFNHQGRLIDTRINRPMPRGDWAVAWNANGYPSGVYYANISIGNWKARSTILYIAKTGN